MTTPLQKEAETILKEKIRIAWKSYDKLRDLDKRIEKHYNAGTISLNGFKRLDSMILNRMVKLDTQ